jgi:hypothetical protein
VTRRIVRVVFAADGLYVSPIAGRPGGWLRQGAFDPRNSILYLGGPGHANGCAAAGADPIIDWIGISVFVRLDGCVYWANDSMSLPRILSDDDALLIQQGLASVFAPQLVGRLDRIGDVPLDESH